MKKSRVFISAQTFYKGIFLFLLSTSFFKKASAQYDSRIVEGAACIKHFATEVTPDGVGSVMAGTELLSYFGWKNRVTFLKQDFFGNYVASKAYTSLLNDERAIDITGFVNANGDSVWYITCLSRGGSPSGDRIKVLCIDETGAILSQRTYEANASLGGNYQLYPMHSLLWHKNQPDMSLFICGYATDQPGTPDYSTNKHAFVMKIDLNPGSHLTPYPSGMLYDYVKHGSKDYDMALRMVQLENSDEIFVTGSVNATAGTPPAVLNHHSAVMNMVINPFTLTVVYHHPFTPSSGNHDGDNEGQLCYGQDLIQYNGQNYVLFNFSNFSNVPWQPAVTDVDMYPRDNKVWAIAPLNGPMDPFDISANVYRHDDPNKNWAGKAFKVQGSQVVIASQVAFDFMDCDPSLFALRPDYGNVITALSTVDLNNLNNGAPYGVNYYMNTGHSPFTITPTGEPGSMNPYPFWEAGGQFSNIDYPPVFAGMYGDGSFVMNAPRYQMNGPTLAIKYQHPDPALQVSCQTYSCGYELYEIPNRAADPNLQMYSLGITTLPVGHSYESVAGSSSYLISAPCENNGGYSEWKTTGLNNIDQEQGVSIYPNPAKTEVSVSMKDVALNNEVEVRLMNMVGQSVKSLYVGKAANLSQPLQLPAVPKGMYFIKVTSNEKTIRNEKIIVE